MSDIDISLDPTRRRIGDIHAMLRRAYWCEGIRREVVAAAFANSLAAGAYLADGRQIGVARVVTDFVTFAWICDVFVDEAWRGRGLAQRMMAAILAEPRLQGLRRFCLATRDAHTLYQRFGFEPVVPGRWLERKGPESAWREPAPI